MAADAGVTRQTLYLHFGTRGALLVAVVQHLDETLGLHARLADLGAIEDPVEALEAGLRTMLGHQQKIHGVAIALARMALDDADAREAYDDRMGGRREGILGAVRAVQRGGRLHPDWPATKATDALVEASSPWSWEHLVVERGWTPKDFERWILHVARSFVVDRTDAR